MSRNASPVIYQYHYHKYQEHQGSVSLMTNLVLIFKGQTLHLCYSNFFFFVSAFFFCQIHCSLEVTIRTNRQSRHNRSFQIIEAACLIIDHGFPSNPLLVNSLEYFLTKPNIELTVTLSILCLSILQKFDRIELTVTIEYFLKRKKSEI